MTIKEIINKLSNENKTRFIVCNEWLVDRSGSKISVNHTYHFKGESFDNLKDAEKYLRAKLNYLIKRGYHLSID